MCVALDMPCGARGDLYHIEWRSHISNCEAIYRAKHIDKHMLVCIINKRQIGEMMKIIKSHPGTFASFQKGNAVFGNFRRNVN